MDLYPWLKLIHILSATFLFGTGLGTAFFMWRADVSGDIQAIAVVARNVVRADFLFTLPSVIIQPVTGIWLLLLLQLPLTTPWVLCSLVLYGLVGCFWIPVVFIQMRAARVAEELARNGRPPDQHFRHLMRWWYGLGWPAFISVIIIFYLMVFK
jgi:uncharacterized membrane protein